jgi:hypothetical protein
MEYPPLFFTFCLHIYFNNISLLFHLFFLNLPVSIFIHSYVIRNLHVSTHIIAFAFSKYTDVGKMKCKYAHVQVKQMQDIAYGKIQIRFSNKNQRFLSIVL